MTKNNSPKPLTSPTYCMREVIESQQCGIDANEKETSKLYISQYFKSFPLNYRIQFLPSSLQE